MYSRLTMIEVPARARDRNASARFSTHTSLHHDSPSSVFWFATQLPGRQQKHTGLPQQRHADDFFLFLPFFATMFWSVSVSAHACSAAMYNIPAANHRMYEKLYIIHQRLLHGDLRPSSPSALGRNCRKPKSLMRYAVGNRPVCFAHSTYPPFLPPRVSVWKCIVTFLSNRGSLIYTNVTRWNYRINQSAARWP